MANAVRRAYVTPSVLRWARERAHVDVEQAARKVKKSTDQYLAWEAGGAHPTMRQAEVLADLFLVPLATFFRESPPAWPDPLVQMRRLPGLSRRPSPELVRQVRLAYARREAALDLIAEIDEEPPAFQAEATTEEPAEAVADRLRYLIGITVEEQVSWPAEGDALNRWREAVERTGVLVFQVPYVDLADMRGFAIAERPLPVIGYNAKDSVAGRIFTLIHELAHIVLGQSTLEGGDLSVLEDEAVERFCNEVAAAVLVPSRAVLTDQIVASLGPDASWMPQQVQRVARKFKVSDAVMARRLRDLGRVNVDAYGRLYLRFSKGEYAPAGSGGNPYTNAIKRLGQPFLRLAFSSAYQEKITPLKLSGLVGVSVGKLGNLEQRVIGRNVMFSEPQ